MDVKDLAAALGDKLEDPFRHPDMNRGDIDWKEVWRVLRDEIDEAPVALQRALEVIARRGAVSPTASAADEEGSADGADATDS